MSDSDAFKGLEDGKLYKSVDVTKNTKGYNWSVKVSGLVEPDSQLIENEVKKSEDTLKKTYTVED